MIDEVSTFLLAINANNTGQWNCSVFIKFWSLCFTSSTRDAKQGREADHSLPTSAEVKKMWIYTSTPPYAFVVKKMSCNVVYHFHKILRSSLGIDILPVHIPNSISCLCTNHLVIVSMLTRARLGLLACRISNCSWRSFRSAFERNRYSHRRIVHFY
jgi:hypothetical protein